MGFGKIIPRGLFCDIASHTKRTVPTPEPMVPGEPANLSASSIGRLRWPTLDFLWHSARLIWRLPKNLRSVRQLFRYRSEAKLLLRSGLFDRDWYLANNPDVASAGASPALHYIMFGAAEGRDPHPSFDTDWYLDNNPDVAKAGTNAAAHYLKHGAAEGRDPRKIRAAKGGIDLYICPTPVTY